jgi:hypothetical protein
MISRHLMLVGLAGAVVAACGGSNNHNQPDAAHVDAPKPIDAQPDGPPVPTGIVSVTLTSLDELSYTGPVTIGGQAEQCIMDTGSTTLGVASNTCANCDVTPVYTPGASAVDQHAEGSSTYADGTGWSGEIYKDFVQLGTAGDVDMRFVAMGSSSGFFRSFTGTGDAEYQGILGLGPLTNAIGGTDAYTATIFTAGEPSEFAFQLCPDTGTMWVGGVDGSAEAAAPAQTAMIGLEEGFYGVNTDVISLGSGSSFGSASDFGIATIIDTGTSIAFIPPTPLAALTAAIQGSEKFKTVFPNGQDLGSDQGCPTSTLTAAEIDADLPPLHVAFPDANGSDSVLVDLPATHAYLVAGGQGSWCFGFEDSTDLTGGQGPALSLFGDSLLNSWVVDFNVGTTTMGFALESGCDEAVSDVRSRSNIQVPPRVPGIPWWKQDPRVRTPDPKEIQRKIAAYAKNHPR